MSTLTYHVATSLDGYIAHTDGSFDGFAWDDEVVRDFFAELAGYSTVLMGRKTYEVGLREGKTSPYPDMRQIVFSRSMTARPDPAVELVCDQAKDFVRSLKAEQGGPIWLCGGSELAATLLAAGLIDQLKIKLNPVLFGAGIPLFAPPIALSQLRHTDTRNYACGITVLSYELSGAGEPSSTPA